MSARLFKRSLFGLFAAVALILAACGQAVAPAPSVAPSVAASPEPAVVEAPAAPDVAFDMQGAANTYLASLPENFNAITKVEGLSELMAAGDVFLLDVREPAEFAEGHIPGAVNIPIRTLAQNLDKIPTDRPVVVTCASGLRASLATTSLHLLGYRNVRDFYPSFKGWQAAELEVATDVVAPQVVGAPEVDPAMLAAVDAYLSALPEGFNAIGKVEALADLLDTGNVFVLDVREPAEFAEGHIPGAVNVPIRALAQNLDKIPTDQPVVISCKSGLRAALAAPTLAMLGYNNVRVFPPSFAGWEAAGMPIEN